MYCELNNRILENQDTTTHGILKVPAISTSKTFKLFLISKDIIENYKLQIINY